MSLHHGTINWHQTFLSMAMHDESEPFQLLRQSTPQPPSVLNLYMIDCSHSMLQSGALSIAKGILLSAIDEAYQRRQRVAIIEFGGRTARISLKPQRGNWQNAQWVDPIAGGGGTPLMDAMTQANHLMKHHLDSEIHLFLMTDGLVPDIPDSPHHAAEITVIDLETGPPHSRIKQALEISKKWKSNYVSII